MTHVGYGLPGQPPLGALCGAKLRGVRVEGAPDCHVCRDLSRQWDAEGWRPE